MHPDDPLLLPVDSSGAAIKPEKRHELDHLVRDYFQQLDARFLAQPSIRLTRWIQTRQQLLSLFGIDAQSVVLNAYCCCPCESGAVIIESDECCQTF